MHPMYSDFISHLDLEDKDGCVRLTLSNLDNNTIDIVSLYNEVLTPALYADFCTAQEKEICIWKEHVRTSIVRTILECCYPYILGEKATRYSATLKGKALVLCPPGELHEIGARMVADYFTLCGFSTTFAGANTPQDDIVNAIKHVHPEYVAISITNYFNLVAARTLIRNIAGIKFESPFKIILGGQACRGNPAACEKMGADAILDSFADIQRLDRGGNPNAIL